MCVLDLCNYLKTHCTPIIRLFCLFTSFSLRFLFQLCRCFPLKRILFKRLMNCSYIPMNMSSCGVCVCFCWRALFILSLGEFCLLFNCHYVSERNYWDCKVRFENCAHASYLYVYIIHTHTHTQHSVHSLLSMRREFCVFWDAAPFVSMQLRVFLVNLFCGCKTQ